MSAPAHIAYHESGHAVMAVTCGVHFDRVCVYRAGTPGKPAGEVTGFKQCPPITDFAIDFAGPVAECLFLAGFQPGDDPIPAWRIGLERANTSTWSTDIEAMRVIKQRLFNRTANQAADQTLRRIARRWPAVQTVACVLARRRVLSRDEVQILISKGDEQ